MDSEHSKILPQPKIYDAYQDTLFLGDEFFGYQLLFYQKVDVKRDSGGIILLKK